ncbi:protein SDA1-like [Tropilaelaps mercedesae]|uniref:Protein SDA1 n=1 Tax=Tropilaelaps mercedesae TaxID=418985 RepID=A0A1V9X3E7_9ACAR|nr:protein SDA1-like [Tropilaelaps mercedesae]
MKARHNNQLAHSLPQLQNLVKRDPASYKDEVRQQWSHYRTLYSQPSEYTSEKFERLTMFLANVCKYYEFHKEFIRDCMELLKSQAHTLTPDTRLCLCRALIMMRNKSLLEPLPMLELFFGMFRVKFDKNLREFLKQHIIADIKNTNQRAKSTKLNNTLQNFMFTVLNDSDTQAAKQSLDCVVALYQKQVWNDPKTVNVIATACFHPEVKVMATAVKFFLGTDEEVEQQNSDSDSESDAPDIKEAMMTHRINKKTRKRQKWLNNIKRKAKKAKQSEKAPKFNFSALHLIHDPQTMAEKLLKRLGTLNERFEVKLMILNLISRLIGVHQLMVFNFYPVIIRYMQPHQCEVTKILQYAAQACHELIPPDTLEPVIRAVANNFISERNSVEAMTVGLNAVREICSRAPLAMDEDLLSDLVTYRGYRDKNVSTAAKSIVALYRQVNPELLKKKYRARPTAEQQEMLHVRKYGQTAAAEFVHGAEVLNEYGEDDKGEIMVEEDNDDESQEINSDDDGEWVDISHSEDERTLLVESNVNHEEDEELNSADESFEADNTEHAVSDKNNFDNNSLVSSSAVLSLEERRDRAKLISSTRILSQKEFAKVRRAQLAKKVDAALPKRFLKKKNGTPADDKITEDEASLFVDSAVRKETVQLRDIEKLSKKLKNDKAARMASIQAGREDREKYGGYKQKKAQYASLTNKQKRKTKTYNMIKHKVGSKVKRSFRDKQLALKASLRKIIKHKY